MGPAAVRSQIRWGEGGGGRTDDATLPYSNPTVQTKMPCCCTVNPGPRLSPIRLGPSLVVKMQDCACESFRKAIWRYSMARTGQTEIAAG